MLLLEVEIVVVVDIFSEIDKDVVDSEESEVEGVIEELAVEILSDEEEEILVDCNEVDEVEDKTLLVVCDLN